MTAPYPVVLDLADRPVLVVGGGRVAERKVEGLLEAGARVRVVAPRATDAIVAMAEAGRLELEPRAAGPGDLQGAHLVYLATDVPEVNRSLEEEAERRGIWVSRADRKGGGSFSTPAQVRRGEVLVTVSTGGRSPALARCLRARLEQVLDEGWDRALHLMERLRAELEGRGLDAASRARFWERFPDPPALEALLAGAEDRVREEAERCLSAPSA